MEHKSNNIELSDSEFIEHFVSCTFNPKLFNHEAHLRLAWLYIRKHGIKKSKKIIQSQLFKYDEIVGKGEKFHTTLTVASIEIVNHFMEKSKSNSFIDFIEEFPRLRTNFKDLISAHYSFDICSSEKARAEYLEPDLLSF